MPLEARSSRMRMLSTAVPCQQGKLKSPNLALESALTLPDGSELHAGVPSISGDDAHAHDDVGAAAQSVNRSPSATGGCRRGQQYREAWRLRLARIPFTCPPNRRRLLSMSLATTRSLGPGQTGLCCLSLRRPPSSPLALALRPLLTSVMATERV